MLGGVGWGGRGGLTRWRALRRKRKSANNLIFAAMPLISEDILPADWDGRNGYLS